MWVEDMRLVAMKVGLRKKVFRGTSLLGSKEKSASIPGILRGINTFKKKNSHESINRQ